MASGASPAGAEPRRPFPIVGAGWRPEDNLTCNARHADLATGPQMALLEIERSHLETGFLARAALPFNDPEVVRIPPCPINGLLPYGRVYQPFAPFSGWLPDQGPLEVQPVSPAGT